MSVEILKKQLKEKNIGNLYLFYGPEEYLKKYYLASIEKCLLNPEFISLNRVVLEDKISINSIVDNCETLPAFSERKVVIVKNSGFFKAKKRVDIENLAEYFNNIPDHTCLVFYEEEVDKRMKIAKSVRKNGLVVEFGFQKPAELVKWVTKVFKLNGKEIDVHGASWLVDNCGHGMTDILNEIKKVLAYLQESRKVTVEVLEKVCSKSIKTRIFDLTDAIAQKDSTKALKLLNDMIVLKEPLPVIIYMITRQFRHILEMKLLKNEGVSLSEAASKIGLTPYAARKVASQADNFTIDRLKTALEKCLEVDTSIKTGKVNDRIATELLITEFSK